MAKDPAILFYTSDFLVGTLTMSNDQVGKYIRLLCLQHQRESLSEKDMLKICETHDEDIFSKFKIDEDGNYYNDRLRSEAIRRSNYSKSRSANRKDNKVQTFIDEKLKKICLTCVNHMETETETINSSLCKVCYNKSNFKKNQEKIEFSFDFVTNDFKEIFMRWIKYKTEIKDMYKTQMSLEQCYKNLLKFSGNDISLADRIVSDSIGNGYLGFFEPKQKNNYTQPTERKSLQKIPTI